MKTCFVNVGKGYPVYIENNIISNAGAYIRDMSEARTACVVSDSNVFPLYAAKLCTCLQATGFRVVQYVFKAGEASKTMATVAELVAFFAENGLTRDDLAVSLGGGVTGDITGFAAAIYLRGIDYVQVPTSLLAQVDASVGGKTAVDLPQGKNLCGAFHQPLGVLIDPALLSSLPQRFIRDGMAEAIKMASLMHSDMFERIETGNISDYLEEMIYECVRFKAAIVERDETDCGERALLNFGHSVGHAIEKLTDYSAVSHGEAVAIGMVTVTKAAEWHCLSEKGTAERIANVLRMYGLPTAYDIDIDKLVDALRSDKKRTADGLKLILLNRIGEACIHLLANDEVKAFFEVLR